MSLLLSYEFQTNIGEDSSGNGVDITNTGVVSATDPLGQFGDVASFDGTSSSLTLAASDVPSGILGNSPRTFSVWIYPGDSNTNGNIVVYGSLARPFRFLWNQSTRTVMVVFAAFFHIGTIEIPVDSWAHVAVTFDASDTMKTYVNGVVDLSFSFATINTGAGPFALGRSALNGNLPMYKGYLADFRAYDDALDAVAVAGLYSDGPLDLFKIVFEATMYTHLADVSWNSVFGANVYTATYVADGIEHTMLQESTELSVATTELCPGQTYEFRLYTDSDPSTPVVTLAETTPVLDASTGSELAQRLDSDFTSLVKFNASEMQPYLNDVFETGDIVKLVEGDSYVFVKDSDNIAFTPSEEIQGILTPFQPVGGDTQEFTFDADTVSYDELSNEVSINSVPIAPGGAVVLNGYKVTLLVL